MYDRKRKKKKYLPCTRIDNTLYDFVKHNLKWMLKCVFYLNTVNVQNMCWHIGIVYKRWEFTEHAGTCVALGERLIVKLYLDMTYFYYFNQIYIQLWSTLLSGIVKIVNLYHTSFSHIVYGNSYVGLVLL
jgi:hypothetical protein